jgi:hypothetical protein
MFLVEHFGDAAVDDTTLRKYHQIVVDEMVKTRSR